MIYNPPTVFDFLEGEHAKHQSASCELIKVKCKGKKQGKQDTILKIVNKYTGQIALP